MKRAFPGRGVYPSAGKRLLLHAPKPNRQIVKNAFPFFLALLFSAAGLAQNENKPARNFNKYGHANVTASRLAGTWKLDSALSVRLNDKRTFRNDTVQFTVDSTARTVIPKDMLKPVADKQIFLSGYMIRKGKTYPFVLLETDGNTRLVFFRDSREGVKYGDGESFILFMAVSGDRQKDLLFTGGDFNNEPFRGWIRLN